MAIDPKLLDYCNTDHQRAILSRLIETGSGDSAGLRAAAGIHRWTVGPCCQGSDWLGRRADQRSSGNIGAVGKADAEGWEVKAGPAGSIDGLSPLSSKCARPRKLNDGPFGARLAIQPIPSQQG